ncbi:TetR/AcrR family transcriptional regulator [Nocardia carnea]|uniref:TetR/AcrR family transcriptional regulator n=1 Tax=Nocardia carnea TaxID=37328 RepID=UPI00245732D3|nr:TetR/AcrR family transcriptional regulator [Nocardia carnea]
MVAEDDPRYIRSRRLLRSAVIELAGGNPQNLTISQICKHTGVDRATFYRHFPDVEHLVADALVALADESAHQWEQQLGEHEDEFGPSVLYGYIAHVGEHRPLYRWALGSTGSAAAIHGVLQRMVAATEATLRKTEGVLPSEEIHRRGGFAGGAVLGTLLTWLSDPEPASAVELAMWVNAQLAEIFR